MPALLELLDQYFFADVPGMQARTALIQAWEQTAGMTRQELYIQSTADALAEELPHLSAYSGYNTLAPSHQALEHALTTDLGQAGNALRTHDLSSGAYLTELARAMQAQRLILVNQHNLFTDEYRQILLNLFDFAHARFKRVIADQPDEFATALNQHTQNDSILTTSIATFLARQFGVILPIHSAALPPPPPLTPGALESIELFDEPPPSANFAAANETQRTKAPSTLPTPTPPLPDAPRAETIQPSAPEPTNERTPQNRLRVLLATPADVASERALLTQLIHELSARARARFGLDLELILPTEAELGDAKSAVELADIFIGAVWLQFGATAIESDKTNGENYFAGAESDFALALEQAGGRAGSWLRTVIYRSIRPPLDLLHLNVAEYTRVQQFFERAGAFAGEDFVRVYNDTNELRADAHARLEAWIYNYIIDLANALTEYGKNFARAGQLTDALADLEQAGALYHELDRPEQELNIWLYAATLYRQANQPAQAAKTLDAALRLARLTADDNADAAIWHQRGLLAADAQDWRGALDCLRQARAALEPDAALYRAVVSDEIAAHEQLGDAASEINDTFAARDEYRAALARAQEIDDAPRAALLWQKLGALAETRGEWADALEAHRQAAVNLDANAPSETRIALVDAQAAAQLQLAKQARDAGEITQAEEAYRAALDLNEQGSRARARRVEIFASLGALAAGSADWERAIATNNLALEQLAAANDAPLREPLLRAQADAYRNLGAARFTQQSFDTANDAYREAFALYEELDARAEQGECLRQLGNVASAQARWDEANAFYTQALGQLDSAETRAAAQTAQANALTHIGDAHSQAQAWGQAEIAYLQARGNLEQLGKGSETGGILAQLGVVTAAQGRPQEALAFFEQARARLRAPDESERRAQATRAQANTWRQIADMRRSAGDFVQAEAAYRQQLDLAQELQSSALESDALHHLGLISADRENWDDAIQFYDAALTHLDETAPADARALIQRHQLSAYEKLGERERAARQFPQAEMAYRSALAYAQALRETEREADCLNVLGLLSIEQENWDEALFNLRRALGIYNLMPAAPQKPQVIWNIGRAQRGSKRKQMEGALAAAAQMESAQDFDGALREYTAAAQLAQEVGERSQQADALYRLGQLQAKQTRWQQALLHFDDARALAETESFTALREQILARQQDALRALANEQRLDNQTDLAEENYNRALGLALERNDRVNAGELYFVLGALAADENAWEKALGNYALALDQVEPSHHDDVKTYQALAFQNWGDAQRAAGQFDAAASAYASALQAADELNDDERAANVLYRAGLLSATMGHWNQALELYEQAQARGAANDPLLREAFSSDQQLALRAQTRARLEAQLFHAQDAEQNAQWQDAATAYRAALQLARALDDAAEQERAQLALVAVYDAQAKSLQTNEMWDEAQIAYRESWNLAREFQLDAPRQERERALLNLGLARVSSYRESGALAETEQAAQMTLQLAQEFGDTDRQADMLSTLGVLAAQQKHWTDAKIYLEQARPLLVSTERSDTLVRIDQELLTVHDALRRQALQDETLSAAQAALQANDLTQAEASYRRALALARGLDNPVASADISAALVTLAADQAHALRATAAPAETEHAYRQALAVAQEFGDAGATHARQQDLIALTTEHAQTLRAQEAWDDSARMYRNALDLAQEFNDADATHARQQDLITLTTEHAQTLRAQEAWDDSAQMYRYALDLAREFNDADATHARQQDLIALATAQMKHYQTAQAIPNAERAAQNTFALGQEFDDLPAQAEALLALGELSVQQAHWTDAKIYLEQARPLFVAQARPLELNRLDASLAVVNDVLERQAQLQTELATAATARAANNFTQAEASYRRAYALARGLDNPVASADISAALVALAADQAHALRATAAPAETEHAYRQALAVAQEFGDADATHARQQDLIALATEHAQTLRAQEAWDDSAQMYRNALDLAQEFGDADATHARQQDLITLTTEHAQTLRAQEAWDDSAQMYRNALDLAQEFGDADATHARQQDLIALTTEHAQTLRAQEAWDGSARMYRNALDLAREFNDADHQVKAHYALGQLAATQNDWQTALDNYNQSVALLTEPQDAGRVAEIGAEIERVTRARKTAQRDHTRAQGDAARQNEQWQDAEIAYRDSLTLSQELDDTAAQGEIQIARAQIAAAQTDWTQAAALYASALALVGDADARHAELTRQKMQARHAAGDFAAQQEDWAAAHANYAQALSDARQLGDASATTTYLGNIGDAAAAQNDWQSALNYYDAALQTVDVRADTERHELEARQATIWQRLGAAEMDAQNLSAAQAAYEKASELYARLERPHERAVALHQLGLTHSAQANWRAALDAQQSAYTLARELDAPIQPEILKALGDAHLRLGNLEAARAEYSQALALTDTQPRAQARLRVALGEISVTQQHWQDAISHFTAATVLYQAQADAPQVQFSQDKTATCYFELGDLNYGEGNWQAADAAYVSALALDNLTGRADRAATIWYRLARADAAQEQYAEALEHYNAALAALDENEIQLRDRILGHLAFTLQQQGKQTLAQGDFRGAQAPLERALKMALASNNLDQAADVSLALGHALTAQEKYAKAQATYRSALVFDERAGNALRAHETNQALANCLLANARADLDDNQKERAQNRLVEAMPYAEQSNNPLLRAQILETSGDIASAAQPEQAVEYYAQAARQYASLEAMDLWRDVSMRQANILDAMAQNQSASEMHADAENSYRRALLLRQAGHASDMLGETYLGLGRALSAQEQWAAAADAFDNAQTHWQIERASRGELFALHAQALEHLGAQAFAAREWDDARAAYQRAAEMQDALEARGAAGKNWHKLAQIAVAQEAWRDAADANTLALARLDATDAPETRRAVLTQQAEILGHIGQQQQHAGELGLSAETYRSALDIAQEQGDLSTLAELYKHLGSLAEAQAEWDIAAAEYHHALDVEQEMEEPRAQADTWARLGDMHRAAEQFSQASDAYQAARDLYRATNVPLAEGAMLHRLGLTRADAEDWDGALTWYDRALSCYNKHDARAAKIEIYRSMESAVRRAKRHAAQLATFDGDAAMDAGDMPGAEQAYRQALALYIEADERVFQAQMQNQLGVTLEAQGRYDDALEQYQAARLGFQAQEIPAAEISALANIGDVERQRAHWLEAETAYRHALALNQDQDDAARAAELYTLLGQVRQVQNDWEGALDYYQEAQVMYASAGQDTTALEANLAAARHGARAQEHDRLAQALALARENDNRADEGELLNALGLMAAEDNAWDKALRYYRDAVEVFEQLERDAADDAVWRSAQGIVMNNIGDASRAAGDWRQAEAAYTRALGFAREFQDAESEAILLSHLGLGAQQLREYPRALDLSAQALDKYNALGNATAQPELFERIGALQMQLEQTDAAAQSWQQALRAANDANDAERAARLLTRLGYLAEGRDADAEALDYYMRALPLTQELGQSRQTQDLRFRLGQLYARRQEWQAAQDAYAEAYALALAQEDTAQQANAATQLGIVAAQRGDWRAALEYNETALALTDAFAPPQTRAELYQRVGEAHLALDENSDAERAYRSALEIAETAPDASAANALWLKLAELAKRQAHWQDAAVYFASARQTLPADTTAATRIEFALQQGDAALNIPDRDAAQTCYDEAFELALAHDDRAWLGSCYERLGTLAQSRREWDDALAQLQEAIEIQREIHAPLGEARILNDIARLKLEMQNAPEAELFAQAALAIAQAFGSATETSRSLYARALAAAEAQELDLAERFLTQAIAADPNNVAAQLQLGNTLLALGRVGEAKAQAEAGMGHSNEWELGAQAQLTIVALNSDDTRAFRRNLKQTRARANADAENRRVSADFLRAIGLVIAALEDNAESALDELAQMRDEPGLPTTLDAAQFARTALLALASSPRRFKGKPALNTFFAPPKPRARKGARRKGADNSGAPESSADNSVSV